MLKKCCFLFLMCCPLTLWSATTTLQSRLNSMKTFQAHFKQTIEADDNVIQRETGLVSLTRHGELRWAVENPTAQLMIITPKQIIFYDKALSQVTEQAVTSHLLSTPAGLLIGGIAQLTQYFSVKPLSDNKYQLTPKQKNSDFKFVLLTFESNVLSEMQLQDQLEQTTTISFYDATLNQPLAKTLFTFVTPSGVDVISSE